MRKHKIKLAKYADAHEEKEFTGIDGTKVIARNHIPYNQKDAMAHEIAGEILMIHNDACIYKHPQHRKTEIAAITKYYTDINTDDAEADNIADFMINNGLYNQITEYICDDLYEVFRIVESIEESMMKTYEYDNSLTRALRTSFSFLFTGEDITETIAKAETAKGALVDAFNALHKAEKEKEEKIDDGTLSIGGNIINFSKKK